MVRAAPANWAMMALARGEVQASYVLVGVRTAGLAGPDDFEISVEKRIPCIDLYILFVNTTRTNYSPLVCCSGAKEVCGLEAARL